MNRNVYFQGAQRRPVNQQQNMGYVANPFNRADYKQFNEISPEVNAAITSYASPIIQKPYEKMSLNEALRTLQRQGKIEGRDYSVTASYECNNTVLDILNNSGQPIKTLHYDAGITDRVSGYETYQYLNGKKFMKYEFDGQTRKLKSISEFYNSKETPPETFTKEGITSNTTPEEYIDYLKQNNINNYQIRYRDYKENGKLITIEELDNDGTTLQATRFDSVDNWKAVIRETYHDGVFDSVMLENNGRITTTKEFDDSP